ncbi:MAG: SecC motif-containing protein [Alcaligenaceae bacterium]|jgi:hypothetical protein|nr:SecC motif-containing protein [Alcaligenaceae bacterium]
MKIGRNDPCPCGSGKKYKHCCINNASNPHAQLVESLEQALAMNPNLNLDELNALVQHKIRQQNNQPRAEFCGLSSNQLANWMNAPFNELELVTIRIPDDLSGSPVMRYLELMLEEAMQQDGSFKATAKGNLPAKLVKKASELLPEFAIAEFETAPSISDYVGSNEDKFDALHYTRILADLAGIIYLRKGRYHIKKTVQKQYQTQGINAFFLPMLEVAATKFNWNYMDGFDDNVDLRPFWLFMLWRLQSHGGVSQMIKEVCTAFPMLVRQFPPNEFGAPESYLGICIKSRFIKRFLEFWGFITRNPGRLSGKERLPGKGGIQPLLMQTFHFEVT